MKDKIKQDWRTVPDKEMEEAQQAKLILHSGLKTLRCYERHNRTTDFLKKEYGLSIWLKYCINVDFPNMMTTVWIYKRICLFSKKNWMLTVEG